MPRSKPKLGGIILTHEARTRLSGEEICQALAHHQAGKKLSTFRSESGHEIVVVTDDSMTRVMLHTPESIARIDT
jgi:hypothetical protein